MAQRKCRFPSEDEIQTAESSYCGASPSNHSDEPISLEGHLYVRKSKWSGHSSWKWKKRFVFFSFEHTGSLFLYKQSPHQVAQQQQPQQQPPTSVLRTVAARFQRSLRDLANTSHVSDNLDIELGADLPWMAKDVEGDPSTFVIELDVRELFHHDDHDDDHDDIDNESVGGQNSVYTGCSSRMYARSLPSDDGLFTDEESLYRSGETDTLDSGATDLWDEVSTAHQKHNKPLRIYFRCNLETNEKSLWLEAFCKMGRLSTDVRKMKKTILSALSHSMYLGSSRVRSKANEMIAVHTRQLDVALQETSMETRDLTNEVETLARGGKTTISDKEFRVLPQYAYPHRWLTKSEMREEMVLPSEVFHDLRVPNCKLKEIGTLRVEVLQCLGLPKLDRGSDTDAVVYLVCGSYAFSTDIIDNRTNPMWLRKSRRACIFPLHHGYARLFCGVFDFEPRRIKDDFAGRVALDLARLRPQSTYDVTLPLRLSTHVYSRRRRGAIRLRFTLNWHSEREAMLSYLPKTLRIPLPQNSKPNLNTTVRCADQKAFRNIAITVHGAHLPGRFTFNQMRAAIREINFTRKYVFTSLRRGLRETRQWQNPSMSAFVFLSWMHCVIANAFSLVPAYVMLFLFLHLTRNYARFCTDGPAQRGFVPPSWEELFMALLRGGDRTFQSIEPLELGVGKAVLERRKTPETLANSSREFDPGQYSVRTHKPKGKNLLQALGFLDHHKDPNKDHLEFPFADGKVYPRFTVRECLVTNGNKNNTPAALGSAADDNGTIENPGSVEGDHHRGSVLSHFPIDMDLQRMMRKDSSGTKDYDEEEINFNATRAVMTQGRKAASKVTKKATKTATAISSKTGLDSVVRPIHSGITSGVGHVSTGLGHVSSAAGHVTSKMIAGMPKLSETAQGGTRISFNSRSKSRRNVLIDFDSSSGADSSRLKPSDEPYEEMQSISGVNGFLDKEDSDEFDHHDGLPVIDENLRLDISSTSDDRVDGADPFKISDFPDQDIDVQGPSTGKKLTDDLAEIKDKMHELSWHLFDDRAYAIKNPKALFFGERAKPEKRRKASAKQMDKFLHMGQYSHSNPFVARVGTYVEPIIGSAYSILCGFRAGFNVVTWRDPILTFWVSFFCGTSSIVLFFFPWRIFLFVVGIALVGPQNWAIRILREQGHLSPAKIGGKPRSSTEEPEDFENLPTHAPVFTQSSRQPGNEPRPWCDPDTDPREIHHVVVPNTPLFYQRCNDWPPEPEYAQVRSNVSFDEATNGNSHSLLRTNSQVSEASNNTVDYRGMRGRLRRIRRHGRKGRVNHTTTDDASRPKTE